MTFRLVYCSAATFVELRYLLNLLVDLSHLAGSFRVPCVETLTPPMFIIFIGTSDEATRSLHVIRCKVDEVFFGCIKISRFCQACGGSSGEFSSSNSKSQRATTATN